jgi:hypothetical protein
MRFDRQEGLCRVSHSDPPNSPALLPGDMYSHPMAPKPSATLSK